MKLVYVGAFTAAVVLGLTLNKRPLLNSTNANSGSGSFGIPNSTTMPPSSDIWDIPSGGWFSGLAIPEINIPESISNLIDTGNVTNAQAWQAYYGSDGPTQTWPEFVAYYLTQGIDFSGFATPPEWQG